MVIVLSVDAPSIVSVAFAESDPGRDNANSVSHMDFTSDLLMSGRLADDDFSAQVC